MCGQVCLILSDATTITWVQTKQALGKGDMLTGLKKLHPSNVLEPNLKQLKKMVQDKQFDLQRFKLSSRALYLLARWACAFVRYSDIIEKV